MNIPLVGCGSHRLNLAIQKLFIPFTTHVSTLLSKKKIKMSGVPAAVTDAIRAYIPPENAEIKPPGSNETSLIFDYGVRVEYIFEGTAYLGWVCLADAECRNEQKLITLSCGTLLYMFNITIFANHTC